MAATALRTRKKPHPLISTVPYFLSRRSPCCFRRFCSEPRGSLNFQPPPSDPEPSPSILVPGRKILDTFREEFEVGSRTVSIETGKITRLANGSVVFAMEETNVLSTVASSKTNGSRDFLPLTVDYQEKRYAQGVIPTTFMRREGAPKERELLCGRLIDRPIRPLFPAGFYHEVQVMESVLSSDGKHDPDVMAANATSAAFMLSDIPWGGPIDMIRVGRIDGKLVFNPTMDELSLSDLNLVYACTRDKTLMIDVQAHEISEKDLEAALRLAQPEAVKYIDPQIRLAKKAAKVKREYKLSMITDRTFEKVKSLAEEPIEAVFRDSTYGKFERGEALDKITQVVKAKLEEECDGDSLKVLPKTVDTVRKKVVRGRIIEKGLRVDGRQLDEVRPLYCEAGTYPILHGSAIFSRGDTQDLCTVTLEAPSDAQRLDSIVGPPTKRFMLHYSFPPFSINEVGKRGGLNRCEVGHGTLAEKALLAVLPPEDEFPYTVRINSEVMASDGSTAMASVCGAMVGWQRCMRSVLRHAASAVNQQTRAAPYSTFASSSQLPGGQLAGLRRVSDLSSKRISGPFYQYLQYSGFFSSRGLSAEDNNMEPISSPLTPLLGDGKTKSKDASSKPVTVQAIKKGIKQSPKKVNLVAKLVRGMRVEDALLQLQVTVKRAAKTVYQVIHSARANATHNHGLDADRLLVAEAFVGKGLYLKRLSYHAKGRSGIMVRPRCRLTVVVREITAEEEAKIAKLRVSNYKKLTRRERQLVPHQLIETTPRWGQKRKDSSVTTA